MWYERWSRWELGARVGVDLQQRNEKRRSQRPDLFQDEGGASLRGMGDAWVRRPSQTGRFAQAISLQPELGAREGADFGIILICCYYIGHIQHWMSRRDVT